MTNFFKREPFTRLSVGPCEFHPERKTYQMLFLPGMEGIQVCSDCYKRLTTEKENM